MRDFTSDELAGYAKRSLIVRGLVFVQPRDRATGDAVDFGFWNGIGDVTLGCLDPMTGSSTDRDFTAGGSLISIGDIPARGDLTVASVDVTLNPLNAAVIDAARTHDLRQARIDIYRALFSIATPQVLVAPARCRFTGFVNTGQISTPAAGGSAALTLSCVSCTRELTRTNTDLRSDASQQRRHSGDRIFQWVTATGQVEAAWGKDKANPSAAAVITGGGGRAIQVR